MENYKALKLELADGTTVEANRDNTSLFLFMGKLACYNHAFVLIDEDEGMGAYIFQMNKSYEPIANHLLDNHYPLHVNLREVPDCDRDAWERAVTEEADSLDEGIPDDWL